MVKSEQPRSSVLAGIDRTLAAALGVRGAMQSIIRRARRVIGADTGTVFLLDAGGAELSGAYDMWDWTRSSFTAGVEHWPSVRGAMSTKRPVHITLASARGLELDWFEQQGIAGCLCTPLVAGGRTLGVIFWDYSASRSTPSTSDSDFAQSVAASWAAAIDARRPSDQRKR